jgi:hypothetical protein
MNMVITSALCWREGSAFPPLEKQIPHELKLVRDDNFSKDSVFSVSQRALSEAEGW